MRRARPRAIAAGLAAVLLLATGSLTRAEETRPEQDFVAANELALQGDLKAAIGLYESLLARGVAHEDLYFNLGNAYASTGRAVDAIVAYERALRLAPGDGDVRFNLGVVRSKLLGGAGLAPPPEDGAGEVTLAEVVEPLVAPLSPSGFAGIAIAGCFLLFGALAAKRRLTEGRGATLARAGVIVGAVSLGLGLAVNAGHVVVARDPRAVVRETGDLKDGPHARFKVKGKIAGGERVRVLEEDGAFARVLRRDGTSGWITLGALIRL